jgi:TetR/AcrR family transcriptional repressor of lmrAB and yxaGH operons
MPAVPRHRQPIVNAAVRLFRRQGYAGTGLNDIVDESGAPKGSLYHYFPGGKASIAAAAVREAGERVLKTLGQLAAQPSSASQLVRGHAALLARWMAQSGYRDGCPMTTVLLELAPRDRAVAEAGRQAYRGRLEFLQERLEAEGWSSARAASLALLCTSALQGALIQTRVERSAAALEAVVNRPGF